MNSIRNFCVVCLKQITKFLDHMLGLGNGQTVTGYKDNGVSCFQDIIHIFSRSRANFSLGPIATTSGSCCGTKPGKEDIGQRPVHGLAHNLGQNNT